MSILFKMLENELCICYMPMYGTENILEQLRSEEEKIIKGTFCVSRKLLRSFQDEHEEDIVFAIGKMEGNYILLDSNVLMTHHNYYLSKNIQFKQNMFVANKNISIFRKIDHIIERDMYIGGEWEKYNGISLEAFLEMINKFPNSYELTKYSHCRIARCIKEYFPECEKFEASYEKYINHKELVKEEKMNITLFENVAIELKQFSIALNELKYMLSNIEEYGEQAWQIRIQNILQLLYPKYILCTREITLKGVDGYEKRPDFLLVDANGFIDILEIKKPSIHLLTKQASYRNNYVPVREFAGAIQQIEKYIFCLSSIKDKESEIIKILSKDLPNGVTPQVVNPQGILLLGRSNDFNEQQKRDFELIKRQYKNIADIMTYDDLLARIDNIVKSLEKKL